MRSEREAELDGFLEALDVFFFPIFAVGLMLGFMIGFLGIAVMIWLL